MSTTHTTLSPAIRRVGGLAPVIVEAYVIAEGAWDEHAQCRGARIVSVVVRDRLDDVHEREVYDFLPGHDSTQGYGGWEVTAPMVQSTMDRAAEWLAERYPPAPCDPIAS